MKGLVLVMLVLVMVVSVSGDPNKVFGIEKELTPRKQCEKIFGYQTAINAPPEFVNCIAQKKNPDDTLWMCTDENFHVLTDVVCGSEMVDCSKNGKLGCGVINVKRYCQENEVNLEFTIAAKDSDKIIKTGKYPVCNPLTQEQKIAACNQQCGAASQACSPYDASVCENSGTLKFCALYGENPPVYNWQRKPCTFCINLFGKGICI